MSGFLGSIIIILFAFLGTGLWMLLCNQERFHKYPNPVGWMFLHMVMTISFAIFGYWIVT
jgi:hypothetical protein